MSDNNINVTAPLHAATKKGKLGAAKEIFLEGDTQTVEKEIQDINSRHNDLSSKHESLSSTVSDHAKQIESNQSQITANKSAQDEKNTSLDANMAKLNTRDDQITELVKGVTATGGASVATAVTYDNTSSQLTSATVQGAVDELQGSKINKTSISQESGWSEDKVMSQKAVSTKLSDLTSNDFVSSLAKDGDTLEYIEKVPNKLLSESGISNGDTIIYSYDLTELEGKIIKINVSSNNSSCYGYIVTNIASSNIVQDSSSIYSNIVKSDSIHTSPFNNEESSILVTSSMKTLLLGGNIPPVVKVFNSADLISYHNGKLQSVTNVDDALNTMQNVIETITIDIQGGEKDIVKKSYTSESNSVNIPIDGTIVKYGDTITLKLSEPISAAYTIQTRTEDSSIGEKSVQFTDGYATYGVTVNTVAKSLKIVNCNKDASIVEKVKKESIDDNIAALKKNVETIESKNSLLGNSIDVIKDNIDGKDLHLNSYIADSTYIDIQIESPFVYGGTYRFQSDYFENKVIKYSYRNSELSSIGEGNVQASNGYIAITITQNPNAKYLRFHNVPKGTKIDYVSKESTVGYRLEKVEKAIDNIDKVIKHNSIKYGSELKAVKTQPGEIYENCVFLVPSVIVSENVTFRKCDFVNCVVTPSESVTKDMIVEHCNFIGSNARLQMKFLENCQILYNDFKISDSAYPDAAPKTKGENSRNIFVHSINNTKIIGNRIRIGRTGICVLGFKEDVLYEGNLSSCNNVISGNQIDGIGEEHISFDGGVLYDVAKITSFDSIDFVEEDTGQGQENNTENTSMTKIVAKITCSLKDIVAGTSSNCPSDNSFLKNYSHLGNGSFHIVNERNGLHSAVDSFEIVGTMKEDGDYRYASEGTYKISFRMPTIYNYKRQMSEDAKAKMIAKFKEHFAVDDEVVIASMQNYNVISNNVINGIGTDCVTDIDTQGGIVLYSFCFHNVVNGNVLHQKRIWAQGWHSFNYHSKVKMQCDNVISNNTLDNTSISFVYHTLNTPTAYKMNKRNRIVNNVVTGVNDVASIQIDNTEDTYLCGNMANSYRIKNNDKLKMASNSLSGLGMGEGYMTNNTNTVKDETNQVQ